MIMSDKLVIAIMPKGTSLDSFAHIVSSDINYMIKMTEYSKEVELLTEAW
jgi:hypothetical protein